MKTYLITFLLICSTATLKAQQPVLIEVKAEVVKQATFELDQALTPPEGELYKFAQKYQLSGEYTLDITIRNKGEVVSVFVADKKDGNIPSQNSLKDKIMDFKFGFKMPKNKDYKFSYTFKF
jgi:hypothetical protein